MVYFINLIYSTLYFYFIRKIKKIDIVSCSPIIIIWSIIIGGQYNVGTDYFSYLRIFNNESYLELYFRKKEYIFYYLIRMLKFFVQNGQILFLTLGIIENILFIMIIKKLLRLKILKNKYIYIFIYLFLTYGTIFYNQMNGLRQFFNIYLFFFMILFAIEKKYVIYNFIFFIGLNMHRSLILVYPFYFIYLFLKKKITKKILILGIVAVFMINFIDIEKYITEIVSYIPRYSHYIESSFFNLSPLKEKIIKLLYIPFIIESIFLIEKIQNPLQREILKIGIISYIIKIGCLVIPITNRVGEYFTLLSLFPIYFLIIYYIKNNNRLKLVGLLGIITLIYILKIFIFAKGEYLYQFYLFN